MHKLSAISQESELLEKCKSVVINCGREHLDESGKSWDLLLKNLDIHYSIDHKGRQYMSIVNDNRTVLMAFNEHKNNNPTRSSFCAPDFIINSYEKGEWEKRVYDIYSAITFKTRVRIL